MINRCTSPTLPPRRSGLDWVGSVCLIDWPIGGGRPARQQPPGLADRVRARGAMVNAVACALSDNHLHVVCAVGIQIG